MNNHLEDLKEIRLLMERSSKFLSLSGLSGIAVGIVALTSAAVLYFHEDIYGFYRLEDPIRFGAFLAVQAVVTLLSAIILGFLFTRRKAKKRGESLWNPLSKKVLTAMSIPLITGGLMGLIFLNQLDIWPLAGITLIFYGLALINSAHFTFKDLHYLGICEIILGLAALAITGYSLLFWALGFGVLHIIYGVRMYMKYEK